MTEKLIAAAAFVVCIALMLRLMLGARLRWKLDSALQRGWLRTKAWCRSAYHWRSSRRQAARATEEAIRRARNGGTWEGNVFKPKSFKKPPRDKLH